MKKMKYVAPATALYHVEVEGMMALSTMTGPANPADEVLAPEQNWDIWSGK